ncbi:MAG TPA: hypothetical protein VHW93_10415, partial [Acidimicrobiales bacterium]|nr:hypothetical protein [Acidimicrobiales bacterium]
IDGLVARGLVERRTVEGDRRRVDHVITDHGRQVLDAADDAVNSQLQEIAGCLGNKTDTDRAFDGLAMWRRALLASRLGRSSVR